MTQTLALVTLAINFQDELVNQINRSAVALQVLTQQEGGGSVLAWAPKAGGQNAEAHLEGAAAVNFASDAQGQATQQWGLYRANFEITDLASSAAATSLSPRGNADLWAGNMINASDELGQIINTAIHTGAAGGNTIDGLGVSCRTQGNVYAGINRALSTWWDPYLVDPGALTPLSFQQIRTDQAAIYRQCGSRPDLAFVSPEVFVALTQLFDGNRQFTQPVVNVAKGTISLDGGAEVIRVGPTQFIEDKDSPANTITYLHSRFVKVRYLPQTLKVPRVLAEMKGWQVQADGFARVTLPMGLMVKKLATVGASERATLQLQVQLQVERPNACGARLNVAA